MYNILVVDDEQAYFEALNSANLKEFKFLYSSNLKEMEKFLFKDKIHLILMDWNLGKEDGVDITKELKSRTGTSNIPIIMVSGQNTNEKMVFALNQGADDYVLKPFTVDFLVAKINSNLRKYGKKESTAQTFIKNIVINENSHSVEIKGKDIKLSKKEFLIFTTLIKNPENTFSREALNTLDCPGYVVTNRTIDTLVKHIRTKFGDSSVIETISKKGYKINPKIFG